MSDKAQNEQQTKKPFINKSQVQLEDNSDSRLQVSNQYDSVSQSSRKQQQKKITHRQQKEFALENLLDLEESESEKKKLYQQFLQDRQIYIQGPQLVTQNVIKSYKLYKIKSKKADETNYDTSVARRFSDFQFLQKQLVENHGGSIIPLLPQKNIWANINMEGQQQITGRVKGLQKYLRQLLKHKKLRVSQQLKYFLFQNQVKFSQKKGQYYSRIKTEEKIKEIASNAYSIGKGIFSKFISGSQVRQDLGIQIQKPGVEDVKLMQFQREVTDLIKVINILRNVVENSVLQMKNIALLLPDSKQASFESSEILNQFEDLCKYIFSCNQALSRRHSVRLQIQQYTKQLEGLQKKVKSNPRNQQVDILRNKISKSSEKCQRWTGCLLEELEQSICIGKSMIEKFITHYSHKKENFYLL